MLKSIIGLWGFLILSLTYDITCSDIIQETRLDSVSVITYSCYLSVLTILFHFFVPEDKKRILEQMVRKDRIVVFFEVFFIVIPVFFCLFLFYPPLCEVLPLPIDVCFYAYMLIFPLCLFLCRDLMKPCVKKSKHPSFLMLFVCLLCSWMNLGIVYFPIMAWQKKMYLMSILWFGFIISMTLIQCRIMEISP